MKNTTQSAAFHCTALVLVSGFLLAFLAAGCTKNPPPFKGTEASKAFMDKHAGEAINANVFEPAAEVEEEVELPTRFQQPTFLLAESDVLTADEFGIPVGADISSTTGPVSLREIMKKLAVLKGMNVSWANDVDQGAPVDVDIRAEDDFFTAIDNILRQLDYFHEVTGNSIIIKHKDTRKFQVSMPFMSPQYNLSVGGNVLGGSGETAHEMTGSIKVESAPADATSFDVWANIQGNLDQILEIWTEEVVTSAPADTAVSGMDAAAGDEAQQQVVSNRKPGKGYYTIDRPIGLITVTAPRSLLEKVDSYIRDLKSELYRQVSIEAKVVEVTLTADNRSGINWEDLLQNTNNPFRFTMDFQKLNPFFHSSGTQNKFITVETQRFGLILDAIEEQGHVEVLSNPKLSVMNGQPAMISVGENMTYIDHINSSVEDGVITLSAETSTVMSGLGMAVIASIIDDDEVILTLTPVLSQVETPIEYRQIGNIGGEVGLPVVKIREMTTLVKIKNGQMLIVGGLIDTVDDYSESQIPHLGDLSGAGGKFFGESGSVRTRRELVILLRPVVL